MERKADRVAHDLLSQIVRGDVGVGELLPREDQLAERYGVNRGVVREAVKQLEVHRLVRPVRRRGTEVLDPWASFSAEVLVAMLEPGPGELDREVLRDLLEIREQIDIQMAELAAERRSEEDLAVFEEIIERMERLKVERPPDLEVAWSAAIDDYALAIAQATGNRLFVMLTHWHRRVQERLSDVLGVVRRPSDNFLVGLRYLVQLLRDREPARAKDAVRAFHQWATPRILAAAALRAGVPLEEIHR